MSIPTALLVQPTRPPAWLTAGLGALVDLVLPWTCRSGRPAVALLLVGADSRLVTGGVFPADPGGPDRAAVCELRGMLDRLLADASPKHGRRDAVWPVLIRVRGGPAVTRVGDRAWRDAVRRECRQIGVNAPLAVVATPHAAFAVERDDASLPTLQLVWRGGRPRPPMRLSAPLLSGGPL